ncbi:MAG: response regulator [Candidatus Krumholzibacteriia bacterium]
MSAPPLTVEKILLVDDDANLLAGYTRQLRKHFFLETACGGPAALASIKRSGPPAVLVSDMRMPVMDGIQLLSQVKKLAPHTVRMMLTGNVDQQTAIEAVNEGAIFRFLTKPCTPEQLVRALAAGLRQHRLLTAERVLLEQTLNGAVGILTEVLGLVHPGAFSRASRARRCVRFLAESLELPGAWLFELAAALSQIGLVILPPETLARFDSGEALTTGDERIIASCPAVGRRLIEMIPRLDVVGRMVAGQDRRYTDYPEPAEDDTALTVAIGAQMLRAALALDRQMSRGLSVPAALSVLRREVGEFNPELLARLETFESGDSDAPIQALRVKDLAVDMVIHEDILASNGLLLVAKGQAISLPVLERLRSFHEGMGVVEPVLVRVPQPEAVAPEVADAVPADAADAAGDGTDDAGRATADIEAAHDEPAAAPVRPATAEELIGASLSGWSARRRTDG